MPTEKVNREPLMKQWQRTLLRATILGTALLLVLSWWAPNVPKPLFAFPAALGGLLLGISWTWWEGRRNR